MGTTRPDTTSLNFLLHVANVWLVFGLAMLLFRRAGPAFFAAAIWAVHPAGTEAVSNVAGRADLLGALAVLGGSAAVHADLPRGPGARCSPFSRFPWLASWRKKMPPS